MGRVSGFFVLALSLFLNVPASVGAIRGDLCFPLEGWALVGEWHVGSAVTSVRQGWMLRRYPDTSWPLASSGTWLPESRHGSWLRNAFNFNRSTWRDAELVTAELPCPCRLYVNDREVKEMGKESRLRLGAYLRSGTNSVVLACPPHGPHEVRVPRLEVDRILSSGRASRPTVVLKRWRWRRDEIERTLPRSWLESSDTTPWRLTLSAPPISGEIWIPPSPLCLKAVLDFPGYWRGRSLSVLFHAIPGDPDVYVNGEKCVDRLRSPARLSLGSRVRFDARDTLCLVYPGLPRLPRPEDGRWGIAAVHWDSLPLLRGVPRSATLLFDFEGAAAQEGTVRALSYASEMIEVSSTSYGITWRSAQSWRSAQTWRDAQTSRSGGMQEERSTDAAGVLVGAWGGPPFSGSILQAAANRTSEKARETATRETGRIWIVGAPTVGTSLRTAGNSRLAVFRNDINKSAVAAGVSAIPLFDVFRSALRCQNRWPCRASFSDDAGRLTAQGSYLMGAAVIELAIQDLFLTPAHAP